MEESSRVIYVLHEYGAPSHYLGLNAYCNRNCIRLKFYEFGVFKQFAKAVYNMNFNLLFKAIKNLFFLVSIIFSNRKQIVLGIAPHDYRMLFFLQVSKCHYVYYHTSWPFWVGDRVVKKNRPGFFDKLIKNSWRTFLEVHTKGIFFVTETARRNMLENYHIGAFTSVVSHAADPTLFYGEEKKMQNNSLRFLFVGRLEEYKGILPLLQILGSEVEFYLGIAGSGPLEKLVKSYALKYKEVTYYGKVSAKELGVIYRQYDVVLLPSMKGSFNFEELFGITIIEAMLCGLIPVATNHIGPSEIIEHGINGFLIDEANLNDDLLKIINDLNDMDRCLVKDISQNALICAKKYTPQNISKQWGLIDDGLIS